MMRLALGFLVLFGGCGRSDSVLPDTLQDAGVVMDAGFSTPPDAGADGGTTADAGRWCAAEAASCVADGWRFDEPGRCCNSRMTCKRLDAGVPGVCEY